MLPETPKSKTVGQVAWDAFQRARCENMFSSDIGCMSYVLREIGIDANAPAHDLNYQSITFQNEQLTKLVNRLKTLLDEHGIPLVGTTLGWAAAFCRLDILIAKGKDHDRWVARLKLLEQRALRAAKILEGHDV
jgi:hypothetical protein